MKRASETALHQHGRPTEEQRFRLWLSRARSELVLSMELVELLQAATAFVAVEPPFCITEFPSLGPGQRMTIAWRKGKIGVASGAITPVPCEECGRGVVRTYDQMCAAKRWCAGHFCMKADGVGVPCRSRAVAAKLPADLAEFVKKNGRTTLEKNALAKLLSEVREKDTVAIRWEHFWVMLGERLIRSSKGYEPHTVERMIAAAQRWVRETKK